MAEIAGERDDSYPMIPGMQHPQFIARGIGTAVIHQEQFERLIQLLHDSHHSFVKVGQGFGLIEDRGHDRIHRWVLGCREMFDIECSGFHGIHAVKLRGVDERAAVEAWLKMSRSPAR